MLDVQVFCAEESKTLQEKLNTTLKRALGMLSTGINQDRVDEGTKQLDSLLEDLEQQLRLLSQQQREQEEEANIEPRLIENDSKIDNKNDNKTDTKNVTRSLKKEMLPGKPFEHSIALSIRDKHDNKKNEKMFNENKILLK